MQSPKVKAAQPKKKRTTPEHDLQKELFSWVRGIGRAIFPELHMYHSETSGQPRNGGQLRYYKDEGLETGYPDTCLHIARGGYCGLWIELKAPGKRKGVRPDQEQRLGQLQLGGHLVFVLDDLEEIKSVLQHYILGHYVASKPDWAFVSSALH